MGIVHADHDFDARLFEGASVAFGVFDGLHRGHRYLLDQALATAQGEAGYEGMLPRALALTFSVDPDEVLQPHRTCKLMSNDERIAALADCGVDDVVVLPFTREFANLEPCEFLDRIFGHSTPRHLHVGDDFRFGAHAAGSGETLRRWGAPRGMQVHEHRLVEELQQPITATRIRATLAQGNVREAADLLGHPYGLCEDVVRGRGDGADFGFATANLHISPERMVLGDGVYGGYAYVDGKRYKAAISVGISPTFADEATANVEAHLLDFTGDLTARELRLEFVERLRPMIKFDSTDALIAQVKSDIAWIRANL